MEIERLRRRLERVTGGRWDSEPALKAQGGAAHRQEDVKEDHSLTGGKVDGEQMYSLTQAMAGFKQRMEELHASRETANREMQND